MLRHRHPARLCRLLIPLLILAVGVNIVSAAPTAAPPTGAAPAGDVLRPGHLGRTIGDIERMIHFYHDLLGLGLNGERNQPVKFFATEPLTDFVSTPKNAEYRAVLMPIPGTSVNPGKVAEMVIEAIEFRNIERHQYMPALQDPGVSSLKLVVRDLDQALARLKEAGVPVITAGGEPVSVPTMPGLSGSSRAIMVRDPDGYPVELLQLTPAPASNAPAASNIIGAHISLVVADIEAAQRFYRNLIGSDLQTWSESSYQSNAAYNQLRNTPGAEFRLGTMLIPGSTVIMEFIQYRNITSKPYRPVIRDIGVGHVALMVRDIEVMLRRLQTAGVKTLGRNGSWYALTPEVKALYAQDVDDFFIEVMERKEQLKP